MYKDNCSHSWQSTVNTNQAVAKNKKNNSFPQFSMAIKYNDTAPVYLQLDPSLMKYL